MRLLFDQTVPQLVIGIFIQRRREVQ